jgi:hypothetical protein
MSATEKLPLNFVLKRDVIAPIAGDLFKYQFGSRCPGRALRSRAYEKPSSVELFSIVGVPGVFVAGLGID